MLELTPARWDKQVSTEVRIKKPTRLLTNLADLKSLYRCCCWQHEHMRCGGKVRLDDGWVNVSALAGQYPEPLCRKWTQCVRRALLARSSVGGGESL